MKVHVDTMTVLTISRFPEAVDWCQERFAYRTWRIGKDHDTIWLSSVFTLEWFEFDNEADGVAFLLRYGGGRN